MAYVTILVLTATNNSSPFCWSLMDDKNPKIQAQVVRTLFVLQIRDSIQALLHQHC